MRKVKIILPILILFAGILLYLQFGRDVECKFQSIGAFIPQLAVHLF